MSSASFINGDITPIKSSVLWFRKGQVVTQKNNQKKVSLTVENGCRLPTEQEIAKLLYNAKSVSLLHLYWESETFSIIKFVTFVPQISGQIIVLYEALKLTDLEVRLRFHTAHHLEQYFSRLFQNMRVLPFGSSINGFGRKRCDLDLVLVPDDSEEVNI